MTAAVIALTTALVAVLGLALLLMRQRLNEANANATLRTSLTDLEGRLALTKQQVGSAERHLAGLMAERASLRDENLALMKRIATHVKSIADTSSPAELARLGDGVFSQHINSRADDRDFGDNDGETTAPMSPAARARALSAGRDPNP